MLPIVSRENAEDSAANSSAASPDEYVSRRNLVVKLLGGIGAAALIGCGKDASGVSNEDLEVVSSALASTATVKVADTASQLRTLTGGATSWVAVLEGISAASDGGGGVFYWSSTTQADAFRRGQQSNQPVEGHKEYALIPGSTVRFWAGPAV